MTSFPFPVFDSDVVGFTLTLTPTVAIRVKSKVLSQASWAHSAAPISVSCSPQPNTSRSCKTTDTGLVHRVVCPFTPQLSLVLINRLRRDGTLSCRWYTAATGGIRTYDLAIANPAPCTINSPERQSARMSKITNDGLTRSGSGCLIAVPIRQQWTSKGLRRIVASTVRQFASSLCRLQ